MKITKKLITLIIALFILIPTSIPNIINYVSSAYEGSIAQNNKYSGPYKVIRVVDGDTIVISKDNNKEKIRLIGVDTPESVAVKKSRNSKEGKIASNYTKNLLNNKEVYLEYDKERLDKYNRTLAYVYLKNGDNYNMVNEQLLKDGMARTMFRKPNYKYKDKFLDLEKKAYSKSLFNKNYTHKKYKNKY